MALYKRNKTWWTDFSVNGQRFRQSLDTTDWREAQSKEKEFIAQASEGKLQPCNQQFTRLPFSDAADRHVADRKDHLSERSSQTEHERLKPLKAFFGRTPIRGISAESVRAYMKLRKQDGVANKTVNLELGVLRGILKRAKRWHMIADEIRPLPVHRTVGRALEREQKVELLRRAMTREDWQNARLAMLLALNTTMRACEIKGLRWEDVDPLERTVTVRRSKTEAGKRVIPLNAEAWDAMVELYHRAERIGGAKRDHYVLAACENGKINPTAPQKSWRSAWRSLTRAVRCALCGELQNPSLLNS